MKKLLVVLALLTVSTVGLAVEVMSSDGGSKLIYIVDGKKVYMCFYDGCRLVSSDYTKVKKAKE